MGRLFMEVKMYATGRYSLHETTTRLANTTTTTIDYQVAGVDP